MNELDEELAGFLLTESASILNCEKEKVFWEDDVDEYGFDSMKLNQLCVSINEYFAVDISPAVFLEATSLEALSGFLKANHYANLEAKLIY